MNNSDNSKTLTVESFYDALAGDYDLMTGFEQRFVKEKPFFRVIIDKYRIRTALDVGCGTGFHSLLLDQLGVDVTAVDISEEMIKKVEEHAQKLQLQITTIRSSFQDLSSVVRRQFDLVFSLGNSLAHILDSHEMLVILRGFRSLLQPNGVLFLQILNYDRILADRARVQGTKETPGKTFVRFYDYQEERILFNILTRQSLEKGSAKENVRKIPLRPWTSKQLRTLLDEAGFKNLKVFGGIDLQEFHEKSSKDAVLLAGV